jgi:protein-S-isoprenylcysteine O-methyltransferase Ste14
MSRIFTLVYGVLCYAVFLAVFVYAVGFIGGFVTPTSLDGPATRPLSQALAIDVALLAVFALQHSGMARPAFKRWWTRFVPVAAERSTYVLLSSLAMIALFAFWQPIGGVVWRLERGPVWMTVVGLYLFGWTLLLYSTFLIDHFDLFGLKQVWRRFRGESYLPPKFHTPGLYRLVRHPLYIGWLTIFWYAPVMTTAHLLFALMTTTYILIAIQLEERDLVDAFGETYLDYRRRTPMLAPWPRRTPRPPVMPEAGERSRQVGHL